jgi:hypothetical protein
MIFMEKMYFTRFRIEVSFPMTQLIRKSEQCYICITERRS